ncbi:MAG: hypothetical protein HQM03_10825 [Magnetococcales bacterium]|nr:hypothetical protein [Magnetococcales bacterium]
MSVLAWLGMGSAWAFEWPMLDRLSGGANASGSSLPGKGAPAKGQKKAPEKEVVVAKGGDFKRFALVWLMMMLGGVGVWWIWRKGALWYAWSRGGKEEEQEALQDPVVIAPGNQLRNDLLVVGRRWQEQFGMTPINYAVIAVYDAAMLVGMTEEQFAEYMQERVLSVGREADFVFERKRYLVKAYRQTDTGGGNRVRYVPKAQHMQWDLLVMILYDAELIVMGAWRMTWDEYIAHCDNKEKLTLEDYQKGERIDFA